MRRKISVLTNYNPCSGAEVSRGNALGLKLEIFIDQATTFLVGLIND